MDRVSSARRPPRLVTGPLIGTQFRTGDPSTDLEDLDQRASPGDDVSVRNLVVRPLTDQSWPALVDLFGPGGASNGCWCMYWVLGAEYHRRPRSLNKEQLHDSVRSGSVPGLLAYDDTETAVGWCRLGPRAELDWLNRRPELAPVDDADVWSLSCFYVRRHARRTGVMTALIGGAIDQARAAGATVIEAYPIDTEVRGATRNVFPGTATAFTKAGFTVAARNKPDRPVMRLSLTARATPE